MLVKFLEQLSGWLQDGTQCPPAMSRRIFSMAKESLLGGTVVTNMVSRDYVGNGCSAKGEAKALGILRCLDLL